MFKKSKTKTFRLNTIIAGHVVSGKVAFSPAPAPGVLTEIARLEAQCILEQMVKEEIAAGRL
jgi:hypothetical protein